MESTFADLALVAVFDTLIWYYERLPSRASSTIPARVIKVVGPTKVGLLYFASQSPFFSKHSLKSRKRDEQIVGFSPLAAVSSQHFANFRNSTRQGPLAYWRRNSHSSSLAVHFKLLRSSHEAAALFVMTATKPPALISVKTEAIIMALPEEFTDPFVVDAVVNDEDGWNGPFLPRARCKMETAAR